MPWMAQDAVFKKLSKIAEVASLDSEERKKYDESLRAYRDTIVVMEGQFLEGERKGLEKGRAEGEHAKALSMARKMKSDGLSADVISKYTGLGIDEVMAL